MREDLEKKAKELKLKFTAETTDEALGLMIQLAESQGLNSELAEKLVKLEKAAETGTGMEVIKHKKSGKMFYTLAKKFYYNPVNTEKVKKGNGGLVNRGRVAAKGGRTILMKDIEKPENVDALDWLVDSGSGLIKEVTTDKKGD